MCEEKEVKSERKGEYTIQNLLKRERRMTSLEANKQTKSTSTTKRARQTPQEMAKEGQDPFSCVRSRKRISKKRRKAQREKWREGNQHPLEQRKEKRATGTMRVNQRNPPNLPQADSFHKEPRRVSLEEVQ